MPETPTEPTPWIPSPKIIARANVTAVSNQLGLADYSTLHRWSVEHFESYWKLVIERLGISLRRPYEKICDASKPTQPKWLVGARMNIVDSCLLAEPSAPAIIECDDGVPHAITYAELSARIAKIASSLAASGIRPGDAVAIVMPMHATSVAAYLAVISAGAVVISVADSFATDEIAIRLRIAKARLVLTQDVVPWGAKQLPLYEKVKAATTTPIVVLAGRENLSVELRPQDLPWELFVADGSDVFMPIERDPQDAINILFSSGTTGEPKAIPWDHTTPIKCAADAHFHQDIHPGDVLCWPTSLGWMMGPWLIYAALVNRATIALYGQSPLESGFGRFVRDAGVTMLGLVPSLVRSWRQSNAMQGIDWSKLRCFSSSGECSNPDEMAWLMQLGGHKPIIEYCGGTEIGGAYISSTMVQPNIPAAFSTPTLGIDLLLLDESGKPADRGEVFLIGPSIGLSTRLLNRDHDATYFAGVPDVGTKLPLRRHGDELLRLPNGYYRAAGRYDDTMNLGGIKVGCAEIERSLIGLEGIAETAAIAVAPPGGGPSRLVIFAVPTTGATLDPVAAKSAMQQAIRTRLNPLFHIDQVKVIAALPRTATNKVMRRTLRDEFCK